MYRCLFELLFLWWRGGLQVNLVLFCNTELKMFCYSIWTLMMKKLNWIRRIQKSNLFYPFSFSWFLSHVLLFTVTMIWLKICWLIAESLWMIERWNKIKIFLIFPNLWVFYDLIICALLLPQGVISTLMRLRTEATNANQRSFPEFYFHFLLLSCKNMLLTFWCNWSVQKILVLSWR